MLRQVQNQILLTIVLTSAAALLLVRALPLSNAFAMKVPVIAGLGGAVLWHLVSDARSLVSFGAANTVTLIRAGIVVLLIGLIGEAGHVTTAYFAALAALVVLTLDGVDGKLARRRGEASAFGARFDMETDAVLILCLSLLAAWWNKAGLWVVASGMMRYGFIAAGRLLPWMTMDLPARLRRKVICVLQVTTLIACLVPFIERPLSETLALLGLVVLTISFVLDIVWLYMHRAERNADARRTPTEGEVPS